MTDSNFDEDDEAHMIQFAGFLINSLAERDHFVNINFESLKKIYVEFCSSKNLETLNLSSNKLSRIMRTSLSMYYESQTVPFSNHVVRSVTFRKNGQLHNGKSFDFSDILLEREVVLKKACHNIELFINQTNYNTPLVWEIMNSLRRELGKQEFIEFS